MPTWGTWIVSGAGIGFVGAVLGLFTSGVAGVGRGEDGAGGGGGLVWGGSGEEREWMEWWEGGGVVVLGWRFRGKV